MQTESFEFEPAPRDRFIDLPFRLYAGDPRWIPPLKAEVRRLLSADNPFFRYGAMRSFLVTSAGGEVLGRCSAIVNRALRHEGEPAGLIGFFEAEDDPAVSDTLLSLATDWLRAMGTKHVLGPMNFSIWHSYRFMTEGFDEKPFQGEPYNRACYPSLFEGFGFVPRAHWASWDLSEGEVRTVKAAMEAASVPALLESGHHPEPDTFRAERFDSDLKRLYGVIVESFRDNVGHTPIELDEFAAIYGGMRLVAVPELVDLYVAPGGDLAGAFITFPDFGDVFRALRGDASRLAEFAALAAAHPPERLVFHTMGFLKEHRRKGLVETYIAAHFELALKLGWTRAIGALCTDGPTIFTKLKPPTRRYTLYKMRL